MEERIYVHNQIFRSGLTGEFYFAKKARIVFSSRGVDEGARVVIGQKVDITESIQPYLAERFQKKR